jgi:hypothetical protein
LDREELDEAAEAVHGENPASHHVELVKTLFGEGVRIDHGILPFRTQRDFVGLEVCISKMMTWAFAAVVSESMHDSCALCQSSPLTHSLTHPPPSSPTQAPTNFLMKWSVGLPRPEEIPMQIQNNMITEADGVPGDAIAAVKAMGLTSTEDFTHCDKGCPLHPFWPAMQSASSAASLWLAVVADLTPDQHCQALRTDHAVSFARTVASVHCTTDNIAGLNLGQKVLAEKLAGHLSEKHGADPQVVQQKVDSLNFDWNTFDPVTCTVGNN